MRDPHDPAPHIDGARLLGVEHMCPDCGNPPQLLCTTCGGRGKITEAELAAWQRKRNAQLYGGGS